MEDDERWTVQGGEGRFSRGVQSLCPPGTLVQPAGSPWTKCQRHDKQQRHRALEMLAGLACALALRRIASCCVVLCCAVLCCNASRFAHRRR